MSHPRVSPIRHLVIFQELTINLGTLRCIRKYRIQNPQSTIETIQRNGPLPFFRIRILLSDPTRINRVHVNIVIDELLRTCPCYHVQRSLGHICVRVRRLLIWTIEDTFHWWDVDNKWRLLGRGFLHQWLQFAD